MTALSWEDAEFRTTPPSPVFRPSSRRPTDAEVGELISSGLIDGAVARLFDGYWTMLVAFAYRLLSDFDDAEDVVADAFLKARLGLASVNIGSNYNAWLHKVVENLCLDRLRRQSRLRMVPWDQPAHEKLILAGLIEWPEPAAISYEDQADVQRVLAAMSPRHRRALTLREYERLSCQEIGDVMGMSRSAVKSMLFRARDEFRRVYHDLIEAPTRLDPVTTSPPETVKSLPRPPENTRILPRRVIGPGVLRAVDLAKLGITEQEKRLIDLVLGGNSNSAPSLAILLGISLNETNRKIDSIIRKVGASNWRGACRFIRQFRRSCARTVINQDPNGTLAAADD